MVHWCTGEVEFQHNLQTDRETERAYFQRQIEITLAIHWKEWTIETTIGTG